MSSFSHPSKTVTAAELAKLEQAFAANPGSEAWQPLAEAYLAMARYMEAMVVCRKGARVHASNPKPRILLAEVYAVQGKDAKAKEEVQAALQMAPSNVAALRLCGHVQMRLGEKEEGTAKLLAAAKADLTDMKTQALLAEWGIPMPAVQPVAVATASGQRVLGAPASPSAPALPLVGGPISGGPISGGPISGGPMMGSPVMGGPIAGSPVVSAPEFPLHGGASAFASAPAAPTASGPAMRPRTSAPALRRPEWIAPADLEEEPKRRTGSNTALWSLVILFIGVAGGGIYYFLGQHKAERQQKVTRLLLDAEAQFRLDNHAAYQKAAEDAREAIRLDGRSYAAHAYLAYAQAIRAIEHAGGEAALEEARRHLSIAKQSREELSYTHMAEALLETYLGRAEQAKQALATVVARHESEGRRPARLLMTLGALQIELGDLDAASESLEKSLGIAPEPRVYALSGRLARQKGNIPEARRLYGAALRQERNHPDSLIGRSWALLSQEEPGHSYIEADQDLKNVRTLQLSVRQKAMAHMLQALLVARVSVDLPLFRPETFQRHLREQTGIGTDRAQNARAITENEEAARSMDNSNLELRLILAQRLAAEKKMNEAIQELNAAVSAAPSRVHFRIELARLWMRRSPASKEAEEVLRTTQTMAPRNPFVPVLLAQVLLKQNKVDEAISVLQAATANAATPNPDAKMWLAFIFRDLRRDYPQAISLYTGAASEFGRDKVNVARAYVELGIAYEKKGDLPQSIEAYEQAMVADYSFEQAYCRLGDLLEASTDAQHKERLQKLAEGYLRAWEHGACAPKMQQRT